MEPIEISRARAAYNAYNAGGDPATANKNYRGDPCPEWDDLPQNIRDKWVAAVQPLSNSLDHVSSEATRHLGPAEAEGPRTSVTVDEAITLLNQLIASDADAVTALFETRVPCNDAFADHPTVQVVQWSRTGTCTVGMLGILNGLFGINAEGWGHIVAVYSEQTGKVLYCMRRIAAP